MASVSGIQIKGAVFYDSDTPDVEELTYVTGQLLAIRAKDWKALRDVVQQEHGIRGDILASNLQFPMSHTLFDRYVVASAFLNVSAMYSLRLEPGHYVFCAGDLGSPTPEPTRYRASINGCTGEIEITDRSNRVDFQFGELGFSVRTTP